MKKTCLLLGLLVLVAVFLVGGCATSSPTSTYQTDLQNLVNTQWAAYGTGKTNWGGGIALHILCPKGDFFVSTGLGSGVTENINFRSASTTKTFTAASIMLLQQRGLLDIEDKITDVIPGSTETYLTYNVPYKDQITIRQLLEHRAGVFDVANNDIPTTAPVPYAGKRYIDYVEEVLGHPEHTFTIDELVGVVVDTGLYFTAPGAGFHYSDTGYSMLGKIIERVSGKSFQAFVQDNFLTPNGLSGTAFPYLGTDQTLPSPYATGYTYYQGQLYETTIDNVSPHIAEGNARSTPADLTKWVKLWLSGQAGLEMQYVDMMKQVKETGEFHQYYGLGCVYTPGLGFGHNGGHVGYLTVMRYDAAQDVAIVMFTTGFNADDLEGEGNFMYNLGYAAKEMLGYPTSKCEPL